MFCIDSYFPNKFKKMKELVNDVSKFLFTSALLWKITTQRHKQS